MPPLADAILRAEYDEPARGLDADLVRGMTQIKEEGARNHHAPVSEEEETRIGRGERAAPIALAPHAIAGGYAAGSIQCLVNVDTSAANDDRACVPLNRLGIGVANPATIAYVLGNPYRDEVVEQYNAAANVSLTPFATWVGDVSVALGTEYRKEKISGFVPPEFQPLGTLDGAGRPTTTNRWSVGNYLPTNGSYDVKEAYIETVVPLGIGLEFNGAARATRYSTAGYVTTWKAGATWQPIGDIRLRVTRSRDIRARNLNELFAAGSANSDSVRNPAFTNNGANGPATFGYSANVTGNLNLRPEKSDSWNIGGVLSPRFLPGFNLSVDYFRIDLEDAISTFAAQDIINLCFQGQQQFCDAYTTDPARSTAGQPYLLFRSQPFNAASQLVRGVDIDGSYRLPLNALFSRANGAVTLRGVATRYIDNLFDRDALLLPETGLAANSTYSDLLGRAFRIGIRMETR